MQINPPKNPETAPHPAPCSTPYAECSCAPGNAESPGYHAPGSPDRSRRHGAACGDASDIHDRSIMAARDYQRGEYIGTYWGIYVEEPTPYTLLIEDETGLVRHIEGRNPLRYINHAEKPNCVFDGMHLFASCGIARGEELTFDYGGES